MTNIQIDPEFKALIPPLAPEELAQLEANIIKDGCRDPLVVWQGVLIDGHNRHEICTRNGIEFAVVEMEFTDRDAVMDWMDANQLGRRNLTPDQFTLLLGRRYNRTKKVQGGTGANQHKQKDQIDPSATNTAATLGEEYGVSEATVKRAGQYADAVATLTTSLPEVAKELLAPKTYSRQDIIATAKLITEDPDKAKAIENREVTLDALAKEEKSKKLKEKVAQNVKNDLGDIKPTVKIADARDWLAAQESADLLLTDPPYSTDVPDIADFAKSWLPLALSKLKSTGRAYVCIGAYPEELAAYLAAAMPTQILVWTYRNTLGPQPTHGYIRNLQLILYYQMPDAPRLNCPLLLEQISVLDMNHPARSFDRYHAWQKPMEMGEMFVRHSTSPGDTVIDPFACTGTFLLAAGKLGRTAKGCDISPENIQHAIDRGCVHE